MSICAELNSVPSARGPNLAQQFFLKVTEASLFRSSTAPPGCVHPSCFGHFYFPSCCRHKILHVKDEKPALTKPSIKQSDKQSQRYRPDSGLGPWLQSQLPGLCEVAWINRRLSYLQHMLAFGK